MRARKRHAVWSQDILKKVRHMVTFVGRRVRETERSPEYKQVQKQLQLQEVRRLRPSPKFWQFVRCTCREGSSMLTGPCCVAYAMLSGLHQTYSVQKPAARAEAQGCGTAGKRAEDSGSGTSIL